MLPVWGLLLLYSGVYLYPRYPTSAKEGTNISEFENNYHGSD